MTELILPRNNISGEIPSELGMLSFLQELRLHRNSLRGESDERVRVHTLVAVSILVAISSPWAART